jgi:DNA-binding HxlR family transcriptional regulator
MEHQEQCRAIFLPIRDTLQVVGGKWKLPVVHMLALNGAMRFNELQRELEGITPRMLSRELQELESHNILEKETIEEDLSIIRYRLTAYGFSLEPVVKALYQWGVEHRKKMMGTVSAPF